MSPRPSRVRAAEHVATLAAIALTGCATPAVDVKVPTSSMDEAYRASVGVGVGSAAGTGDGAAPRGTTRIVETPLRPDRPAPIVAAPDIRLAFFYQRVDGEGNLHYPSWVAIPVETFRWVVPEIAPAGGTLPLDGSRSQMAPADPLPRSSPRNGSEPRPGTR